MPSPDRRSFRRKEPIVCVISLNPASFSTGQTFSLLRLMGDKQNEAAQKSGIKAGIQEVLV